MSHSYRHGRARPSTRLRDPRKPDDQENPACSQDRHALPSAIVRHPGHGGAPSCKDPVKPALSPVVVVRRRSSQTQEDNISDNVCTTALAIAVADKLRGCANVFTNTKTCVLGRRPSQDQHRISSSDTHGHFCAPELKRLPSPKPPHRHCTAIACRFTQPALTT